MESSGPTKKEALDIPGEQPAPSGEEVAVSLEGLEFKHPVDIDEAWREMNCNECHRGGSI